MDVHVDAFRIDGQVEEVGGLCIVGDQLFIGFEYRLLEIGRPEKPSVDEEILLGVVALGGRGTADVPLDAHDGGVGLDLQQILLDMAADHIDDPSRQRSGLQGVKRRVVGVKLEPELRVAERDTLEFGLDLRSGSGALVQEAPAGGNVVEEVTHEKLRPRGAHDRGLGDELSAAENRLRAHFVACLPRAQLDLCHGCDRSERLAAEAERMQGIDIVHGGYFARGVAVEREPRIDGRHAAAVVHDLNQIAPPVPEIDRHGRGSRVDGILHHLLHHRRGAIDHLARGDLVCHHIGQQFDPVGHHSCS